jgi:hypothetical protein
MTFRRTAPIALIALIGLSCSAVANAQLSITITEVLEPPIVITDGGALDSDGVVNGNLNVVVSALNPLLTRVQFDGLGARSNRLTGGPSDDAKFQVAGVAVNNLGLGSARFKIDVEDSFFGFPIANPKSMVSSALDKFESALGSDFRNFTSTFNGTTSSTTLSFTPSGGSSEADQQDITPLGSPSLPYVLSNSSDFFLIDSPSVIFSHTTVIHGDATTAVPEPGSLALLAGMLVPGTAFLIRRRK